MFRNKRMWRQQLQRHRPVELRILGSVDDTHAAAPKLLRDAVV